MQTGWYRIVVTYVHPAVGGSYTTPLFRLDTKPCIPPEDPVDPIKPDPEPEPIEQTVDTTACDTLLPLLWRGKEWTDAGTQTVVLKNTKGDDSVYIYLTLKTTPCCPIVRTLRMDSAVCDTLLPFKWQFGDTVLLFDGADEQEIIIPHPRWKTCTDSVYTFYVTTFAPEKDPAENPEEPGEEPAEETLYPIIVNKYNWVILCDNTRVAELFPDRQPVSYKWYKNGELVAGATEDDYSERAELNGVFQLHLTLDNKQLVKSNILYINTSGNSEQRVACYNHLGVPVDLNTPEEELPSGIYINVYRSGDNIRTEKVLK